jgi:hypothetical protein
LVKLNERPVLPTSGAEQKSVLQSNHVSLSTAATNAEIDVAYNILSTKA